MQRIDFSPTMNKVWVRLPSLARSDTVLPTTCHPSDIPLSGGIAQGQSCEDELHELTIL